MAVLAKSRENDAQRSVIYFFVWHRFSLQGFLRGSQNSLQSIEETGRLVQGMNAASSKNPTGPRLLGEEIEEGQRRADDSGQIGGEGGYGVADAEDLDRAAGRLDHRLGEQLHGCGGTGGRNPDKLPPAGKDKATLPMARKMPFMFVGAG